MYAHAKGHSQDLYKTCDTLVIIFCWKNIGFFNLLHVYKTDLHMIPFTKPITNNNSVKLYDCYIKIDLLVVTGE